MMLIFPMINEYEIKVAPDFLFHRPIFQFAFFLIIQSLETVVGAINTN